MSDPDFPLAPATDVTPALLWSGLVVLADRLRATDQNISDHRQENREQIAHVHDEINRLQDRVDDLEDTSLTPDQHTYVTLAQQRSQKTATTRYELSSHLLKTVAAALAIIIIGVLSLHFLGVTLSGTPITPVPR